MEDLVTQPPLFVGLPVYNGEEFLDEAIDAILGQSFGDFVLMISDNASTDRTQELCERAATKDDRVRYVRHRENRGAAFNWNYCVRTAASPFFRWACHDDVPLPRNFEACMNAIAERPDVGLVYPKTVIIDENGRREGPYIKAYPLGPYEDGLNLMHDSASERVVQLYQNLMLVNPLFGVQRTDILRSTNLLGGYKESDRVLLTELAVRTKFRELDEELFLRRMHPQVTMAPGTADEQINARVDPALADRLTFPYWRLQAEQAKAMITAPLPVAERVKCLRALWFQKKRRRIIDDARNAGRYLAGRLSTAHR